VIAFFVLARRVISSAVLVVCATLAYALDPWVLKWGGSGMETSLGIGLGLVSAAEHVRSRGRPGRPLWAFLLGAGVLVRPELIGLFLIGLFDRIVVLRRPRREILRALLAFVVPILPWSLFALSTFGDLIPATVHAKSGHMPFTEAFSRTVKILGSTSLPAIVAMGVGGIAFVRRMGFGGPVRVWLRDHVLLWGWAIGLPVAYVVTRSYVASRYLLLCMPFLLILGFAALQAFGARSRRLGVGLLVLLIAASVAVQATVIYPRTRFVRGVDEPHIALGDWLRTHTSPDALVATHEVGAIGFFAQRPILDTAGLVSTKALPYVQQYRIADLLRETRPSYYVSSGDERTDRQVFGPFSDRMTLLFEVMAHRGGSSERFANPQRMGIYRFDWSR
jgi:hypothetical protein